MGLLDPKDRGVADDRETPSQVQLHETGIQVAREVRDNAQRMAQREPLEDRPIAIHGGERGRVESLGDRAHLDTAAVGYELAQQLSLCFDQPTESQGTDPRHVLERPIRRREVRLEGGILERATGRSIRSVEPWSPMDAIGVQRPAEVEQHDCGIAHARTPAVTERPVSARVMPPSPSPSSLVARHVHFVTGHHHHVMTPTDSHRVPEVALVE